jgi:4,5-DOPA dioxygenase extradiol
MVLSVARGYSGPLKNPNNTRQDTSMAIFVPHGSPMFALHPGPAGEAMRAVVPLLGSPRAIVVVSAHWETTVPTVGFSTRPETLHDFGGFDPRLYEMQYPAPGSPEVAAQVMSALHTAGLPCEQDAQRGLDHGAWIPLRQMLPEAHIPVVPLSVQSHSGPAHAYRVGQALAELAAQKIMVVGSGNITHNLRDWMAVRSQGGAAPDYVQTFSDWVHTQLVQRDVAGLLAYRQQAAGQRAHPTEEHLLPLFTAWGAAGPDAQPEAFFRGCSEHVIAMDGYSFH